MDQPISNASTPPVTPPSTSGAQSPPHNPYQRIASRRAIACVTCAKAKTKCDKGLPCCSRCISKGIKCEPRSTRRTSENSYRPTLKKPFVTPKRYNSTSAMSSFNRHASPRSILTSKSRPMRAASHIDFRTAVKMSQQASNLSGFPTLTPLPTTYNNQTSDASCIDTNSSDPQSVECTPAFEANSILMSGSLTPQTPESIMYHEPVSLMDTSEQWISGQVWPDDSLAPMGLGLECEISNMVPADLWSLSDSIQPLPITQLGWDQSQSSISPQSMSSELMPDCGSVPPLSLGDYSVDDLNPTSDLHNNWGSFQFAPCDSQMSSVMSTPSFVPDFTSYPGTAVPTWEDVFIPGPAPY